MLFWSNDCGNNGDSNPAFFSTLAGGGEFPFKVNHLKSFLCLGTGVSVTLRVGRDDFGVLFYDG
ncbi:MAG TPA: hypothetical protein DDW50_05525 [Firmicutes bacterium]|nr:hypothetical protein [Bacillota bacterium]